MLRRASLTVFLALACNTLACQVPVFRYALERWAPAEYRVTVAPPANDSQKTFVESMRAARESADAPVNLEVTADGAPLQLALHYPRKPREAEKAPIWQAPLTAENVQLLLDSPVRRELRKRLLSGESSVWVLVESGNRAKDDAAFSALNHALREAEASLKLPEGVVTPSESSGRANENADVLRTDLPLKIAFSSLRVRRDDADEAVLLAMLTHIEDDLGSLAGEPMAFPVFGRGRVLEPLIGAGIHKDNVIEHATYLCGACSCEVKDQNPGIDLLMAANWAPVDTTPKIEIVRIAPTEETRTQRSTYAPIAVAVVALLGFALVFTRRKRTAR